MVWPEGTFKSSRYTFFWNSVISLQDLTFSRMSVIEWWFWVGYEDTEYYALIKPINARPYIIRSASSVSFRLKDPLRRDPIIKSIFFILCLFFMDWPLLSASVNSDKAKVTFWFRISLAVHKTVVFYTIVKTIVVYPKRCLYLYNNMCGNHNI